MIPHPESFVERLCIFLGGDVGDLTSDRFPPKKRVVEVSGYPRKFQGKFRVGEILNNLAR